MDFPEQLHTFYKCRGLLDDPSTYYDGNKTPIAHYTRDPTSHTISI